MDETKIYNQALEDITKRMITYYGNIDTTSGASVQYYVRQIHKDLIKMEKMQTNYENICARMASDQAGYNLWVKDMKTGM